MSEAAVILLAIGMVMQNFIHKSERKDLYNRIMSRSFSEYQNSGEIQSAFGKTAHKKVMKNWREGSD